MLNKEQSELLIELKTAQTDQISKIEFFQKLKFDQNSKIENPVPLGFKLNCLKNFTKKKCPKKKK